MPMSSAFSKRKGPLDTSNRIFTYREAPRSSVYLSQLPFLGLLWVALLSFREAMVSRMDRAEVSLGDVAFDERELMMMRLCFTKCEATNPRYTKGVLSGDTIPS